MESDPSVYISGGAEWFVHKGRITQNFNYFGPMLSMSIGFDVSSELKMGMMSSSQHKTS